MLGGTNPKFGTLEFSVKPSSSFIGIPKAPQKLQRNQFWATSLVCTALVSYTHSSFSEVLKNVVFYNINISKFQMLKIARRS